MKKIILIIVSIIVLIIGVIFFFRNEIAYTLQTSSIITKISTDPAIPKFGSKFKIYFESDNKFKNPVFNFQVLLPENPKYYCIKANYDEKNSRYWAEFDIPYLSYFLFATFSELGAQVPVSQMFFPVESNEGSAYHNYSLRMMVNDPNSKMFKDIYYNDSLNYPTFYERFINKWRETDSTDLKNVIKNDLITISREKIDESDVLSYTSYLITKLKAFFFLKDYNNFNLIMKKLNNAFENNQDHKYYFTFVRNDHFSDILSLLPESYEEKSNLQDYQMCQSILDFSIKNNIKNVIYKFISSRPGTSFINIDKSFSMKIVDNAFENIFNDLETKDNIATYHQIPGLFSFIVDFAIKVNSVKYNKECLELINSGISFYYQNRNPKISKDTNDYTTILNRDEGFLDGLVYRKAEWFYRNNQKEKGITILENFVNNNKYTRYNRRIYNKMLNDVISYYYQKDDLANLERYIKKLTEIEEKRGKAEFEKKVIPIRKKLNEKSLTFDEFKKINSVYIPPLKSAPNVSLKHSSGTINPSKSDKTLIFISVDEECKICNDNIPDLFKNLKLDNSIELFAITNIDKKGIKNVFEVNVDIISKDEKNLSAIGYDIHQDNRIIIIKNKKIYIEDNLITFKELKQKYF